MTADLLIALAAASAILLVLALPPRVLVSALVASTFVTRFRIPVLGHHFLVEHVCTVLAVLSLLLGGWASRLFAAATRLPSLLFLSYIAWAVIASLLSSPHVGASLSIAVWLLFSWLILTIALAWFSDASSLEALATPWAACAAVLAIVFWVLATKFGLGYGAASVTGVRTASASSGGLAAYGLSYEPNLLGSTMAIWVFLALTRRAGSRIEGSRLVVVTAGSIALYLSLSRAPLFGLALGIAVWGVLSQRGALSQRWARRRVLRLLAVAGFAVAVIAVASPGTLTPFLTKLSNSTNLQSGTGGERYNKARLAFTDLSGNWVAGLGLNSYSQRHLELTQTNESAYLPTLPLQIVYDTGLIGSILVLFALSSLAPIDGHDSARRARACGLLTVYGISSLATSPFWFGSSWLLIAMAILSAPAVETASIPIPGLARLA